MSKPAKLNGSIRRGALTPDDPKAFRVKTILIFASVMLLAATLIVFC